MWPIQRGTTVVAKLFVDINIAEGSHNSSALVDVVAPPTRLPSNTCSLSGDLP